MRQRQCRGKYSKGKAISGHQQAAGRPRRLAAAHGGWPARSVMVHVVLLAEAPTGTSGGGGGTTRAHTVDERLAAFRELAPASVTVELVPWDSARPDLMLASLRPADVVVALFAFSPAPELRWRYFGECLVPLVPELPNLKLINLLSSGFDEYLTSADVVWLEERGVTVANNGGANAVGVSETVLGLMYTLSRGFLANVANVRAGLWNRSDQGKAYLSGLAGGGPVEIVGSTVGIVGFGNIGRQVARRLSGYDCEVLYYDTDDLVIGRDGELGATYTPFEELLARSDTVTMHVPHTAQTRGMMGAPQFAMMKSSAVYISTCRGPVTVEADLIEALRSGTIAAAGLDVTEVEPLPRESELLSLENCVVTPHNAGGTLAASHKAMLFVMRNVARLQDGLLPLSSVLQYALDAPPPASDDDEGDGSTGEGGNANVEQTASASARL